MAPKSDHHGHPPAHSSKTEKGDGPFVSEAEIPETPPMSEKHTAEKDGPLQAFHTALGIPEPKPPKERRNWLGMKKKAKPVDPEKAERKLSSRNNGVYQIVVDAEKWSHIRYVVCNSVITIALFLQIIVGAAVTALGAGGASHIIVTVFGAANTAIASLLAVLKSQGLPNRLRQDWVGWRNLREYIEERERAIHMQATGKVEGKHIDIWEEIKLIEARYNAVRLTVEANRADSYTPIPPPVVISK